MFPSPRPQHDTLSPSLGPRNQSHCLLPCMVLTRVSRPTIFAPSNSRIRSYSEKYVKYLEILFIEIILAISFIMLALLPTCAKKAKSAEQSQQHNLDALQIDSHHLGGDRGGRSELGGTAGLGYELLGLFFDNHKRLIEQGLRRRRCPNVLETQLRHKP